MKTNKRRLLKDLPFDRFTKGTVVESVNGGYQINGGKTFYEGGGSSDNGTWSAIDAQYDVIETVWDNKDWFEVAKLKHIKFVPKKESITLHFESLDLDDVETLTKGLIAILPSLEDKLNGSSRVWNKFTDITTEIRNRY